MPPTSGWEEYALHVIAELERLDGQDETARQVQDACRREARGELRVFEKEVREEFKKVNKELTTLVVKASISGVIAGMVPIVIALILKIL